MSRIKRKAQVTVELLLVLPVFFLMLFFIMDLGLLAHKIIVVNHAAYELARVGSLLAGPKGGSSSSGSHGVSSKLETLKCEMFPTGCGQIQLSSSFSGSRPDPQAPGHSNEDIIVTLVYPVKLALPGSSYFLADPPRANRIKRITVSVRMPVEKPIFKSKSN